MCHPTLRFWQSDHDIMKCKWKNDILPQHIHFLLPQYAIKTSIIQNHPKFWKEITTSLDSTKVQRKSPETKRRKSRDGFIRRTRLLYHTNGPIMLLYMNHPWVTFISDCFVLCRLAGHVGFGHTRSAKAGLSGISLESHHVWPPDVSPGLDGLVGPL